MFPFHLRREVLRMYWVTNVILNVTSKDIDIEKWLSRACNWFLDRSRLFFMHYFLIYTHSTRTNNRPRIHERSPPTTKYISPKKLPKRNKKIPKTINIIGCVCSGVIN